MDDVDDMDGGQVKTLSVSSILSMSIPSTRSTSRVGPLGLDPQSRECIID
jgi:hypothetical protein